MRSILGYSLIGITLICTYIICHVGLGLFLPIGTSDNSEKINDVLINLSYSYMAGFVFYMLVVYFPKRIAQKKAFLLWKGGLAEVYLKISEIITAVKMVRGIEKEDRQILRNELKGMELFKPEYKAIIYHTSTTYLNGKEGRTDKRIFVYLDDLDRLSKSIKKEISKMIKLPSTPNVDVRLMEIISSIDSCGFLRTCEFLKSTPHSNDIPILNCNFGTDFYDLIQLHRRLSQFKFNRITYKFKRMNDSEIVAMKEEQTRVFQELKMQNLTQGDMLRYYNGIQCRIENGELLQ